MERSPSITEIIKALCQLQAKNIKIKKDSKNPFYKSKYAALPDIQDAIAAPMAEVGLTYSQHPSGTNQLTTMLMHTSGEYVMSTFEINPVPEYSKEKNSKGEVAWRDEKPHYTPQAIGSAITYARRYALVAILGLNVDDEDDDGNAGSGRTGQPQQPQQSPQQRQPRQNQRQSQQQQTAQPEEAAPEQAQAAETAKPGTDYSIFTDEQWKKLDHKIWDDLSALVTAEELTKKYRLWKNEPVLLERYGNWLKERAKHLNAVFMRELDGFGEIIPPTEKEIKEAIQCLADCKSPDDLSALKAELSAGVIHHKQFLDAAKKRFEELAAPAPVE
nr:ERF family protein [uncultured Arsenicibacter sp.]